MKTITYPFTSRIERELTPEEEKRSEWEYIALEDDRHIYQHSETDEWAMSQPVHKFYVFADEIRLEKTNDRDSAIRLAISQKIIHPDYDIVVISSFTGETVFEAENLTITGEGFSFRI